jgi:hypothetical protein
MGTSRVQPLLGGSHAYSYGQEKDTEGQQGQRSLVHRSDQTQLERKRGQHEPESSVPGLVSKASVSPAGRWEGDPAPAIPRVVRPSAMLLLSVLGGSPTAPLQCPRQS